MLSKPGGAIFVVRRYVERSQRPGLRPSGSGFSLLALSGIPSSRIPDTPHSCILKPFPP